jgi:hypothetical protein
MLVCSAKFSTSSSALESVHGRGLGYRNSNVALDDEVVLTLLAAKTMTPHSYSLSYLQVAREEGVYTLLGQGVEVCPCWEGASEVLCQCFFAIFLQKLFSNKTINKVATSKDSYSQ